MLSLSISIDYRTSIFYIQAFPRLTPHSLTWSSLFLLFCWTVLTFAWYVLCCSVTQLHPWTAAHHASLSFTISQSLFKLMSIKSVMPSNHLILCCPLLLLQQGFFPMSRLFASGGQSVGASASASVLPIEYSGLISFRIDWFDLLAVQGTLSLLQHHSQKASILWGSAFFICSLYEKDYGNFVVLESTPETRVIQSYYKDPKCCLLLSSEAEARERSTPGIKVSSFSCGQLFNHQAELESLVQLFFAVVMGLAHLHLYLHLHKLIRQLNLKSDHCSEVPGAVATSFILITIIQRLSCRWIQE